PSNGSITIAGTNNIDEIKVTDMLGQIVYEEKPQFLNTTLQIGNAGIYFISITTGKEINIRKILVTK
ncbi:MAG TPA: T9SS type A sorting domain-containing protein, partial [Bacteroidia bacterium]